ncbi:UPF0061 protein [Limoniibacter endophyticus]|uniref:Protein nucleotidyltransferase YdiU n=2 Tax=Limoniibacter endophyticus TaxID=1565040 RepID=A0A8J3DFF6_9HYPH|nr:YdiU family protein [Limoniibacter endophyticus]GHC64124.1 UPF0061 protein [Limoniibacter endophyticus]
MKLDLSHSYAALPERFHRPAVLQPVPAPRLIALNARLAEQLGLDAGWLSSEEGVAMLAGSRMPAGVQPIAGAYAGHQFGNFVPQLGDGRAMLLGEAVTKDGKRFDIQLKGAGRTAFSRGGDGRAALGPVLREYIVSEAMARLGVPTTRALAAVLSGETVARERFLPGAIFTRVAASHIRVGTFQFFAARGDVEAIRLLADHAIERHYPLVKTAERPYLAFFEAVRDAQARLIAQWMQIGFIHGVMNTDNMTISGETIDYGPCAFMDEYHPRKVFSSIDTQGRYAFGNQPLIGQWNLARLAETLLPLIDDNEDEALELAQGALSGFNAVFQEAYNRGMAQKIGIAEVQEGDMDLLGDLLGIMAAEESDFTLSFRGLADVLEDESGAIAQGLFGGHFAGWEVRWRDRLSRQGTPVEEIAIGMRAANPLYIPRNHQIQAVIDAAENNDFAPFHALNSVLQKPFERQEGAEAFAVPPQRHERVLRTFCGT